MVSSNYFKLLLCLGLLGGLDARWMKNNRIDKEQEPFVTVTLADDSGAKSTLFASCLASSRTIDVKFYSIETSDATNEFFRYVPDSSMLTVPPEWENVTRNPPVTTITDCAEAAHSGGNPMFKYSGGDDCKVCDRSYDLDYQPDCEAEEQDAVFISSSAASKCPLPSMSMVATDDGLYFCVFVNNGPLSYDDAGSWCNEQTGRMYQGPSFLAQYIDLVNILKAMKVESGKFAVQAFLNGDNKWKWPAGTGTEIDLDLMFSGPSTSSDDIVFIRAADDFQVDFTPKAIFKGGVVCVRNFRGP